MPLAEIRLPSVRSEPQFLTSLAEILPPERWSTAFEDRLLHAYGKSTRDPVAHASWAGRFRTGLRRLFPESEEEICQLLTAADRHGVVIIPFGGGSNVAGCIESHRPDPRMVVTANLRRMNRVLGIDRLSQTVRVQAGILGPDLERALAAEGMTLGSLSRLVSVFDARRLGRDALVGDVQRRLRQRRGHGARAADGDTSQDGLEPTGCCRTPRTARIQKRLCIGSEGTLGIVTEVTMWVGAARPAHREFRGYLFPDFFSRYRSDRVCMRARRCPAAHPAQRGVDRTHLSAAFRRGGRAGSRACSRGAVKWYLRASAQARPLVFDVVLADCGVRRTTRRTIAWQRGRVSRPSIRRHGGIGIGRGAGDAFAEGKFDFPHTPLHHFLIDYDVIVDVSETSTVWKQQFDPPLHGGDGRISRSACQAGGRRSWVGCHVSHSYPAGTSLYFSFAFTCIDGLRRSVDPWGPAHSTLTP